MVFISLGENSSGSIGQKYLSPKRKKRYMNGGEKKNLIYVSNDAFNNISDSYMKFGDEFMSVIRFGATAKGNFPHLSYIFHKPETPGAEPKTSACSFTGFLLFISFQRLK